MDRSDFFEFIKGRPQTFEGLEIFNNMKLIYS